MSYDGVRGWSTVFPTAKSSAAASAAAAPARKRTSSARSARPKRGKPPCKYGPRDAAGYCPKKPPAAARSALVGSTAAPKKKGSTRAGLGEKVVLAATRAAVGKVIPRAPSRRTIAKAARARGAAIKKAATAGVERIGAAAGKAGKFLAAPVALSGATVAAVAAAGAASYLATTAVINAIKNRKEREAQRKFQIAQAYRQSRIQAEAAAGRPLTASEQLKLSSAFKAQIKGK